MENINPVIAGIVATITILAAIAQIADFYQKQADRRSTKTSNPQVNSNNNNNLNAKNNNIQETNELLEQLLLLREEKEQIRHNLTSTTNAEEIQELANKLRKTTRSISQVKDAIKGNNATAEDEAIDTDNMSTYPIQSNRPMAGSSQNFVNINIEELHFMIKSYLRRLEVTISTLNIETINWKPFANGNSVGVLATHIAGAVDEWICYHAGQQPVERNRDAEFTVAYSSAKEIVRRLLELESRVAITFNKLTAKDLTRIVRPQKRMVDECTVLWCIIHAIEHTAYHLGEIDMTIHFYDLAKSNQ